MKWETSPFEVSGRFAFYLVKAVIHLSDFYLVYKNVFLLFMILQNNYLTFLQFLST